MRALVRETRLSPDMFVLPLFVCEGEGVRREVPSMPGVFNLSVDEAVKEAAAAQGRRRQQRPALRPARSTRTTSDRAPTIRKRRCSRRSAPSSARCRTCSSITDVCLCEYTDHGHCGIVDRRRDRERSDGRSAGARGRLARRRRRRHRRAVGHDGRPRRRDPPGARRARLREHRDHGLRGEVLFRVLRAVPRRRRRRRRSSATGDRTRWIRPTPPKRCARSSRTSRRAPTS